VFTSDGGHIVTTALTETGPGDLKGVIRVRDAATGAERSTMRGPARLYGHLTLSPDGRLIVAVGGIPRPGKPRLGDQTFPDLDRVIEVWEWGTWRLRSTFATDAAGDPRGGGPFSGLAVSPDGRTLAALDAEATLYGWDLATGRRRFRTETVGRSAQPIADAFQAALAFTPDSQNLTTVDSAARVRGFDTRTGELRWHAEASTTPGGGTVAFFPDRQTVAAGQCLPGNGKRWTSVAATWRLPSQPGGTVTVTPLYVREVPVVRPGGTFGYPHLYRVACSPDGRWMAGVGGAGSLRLFESATGREVAHGRESGGDVIRLVFSPDSQTLLLAGQDTLELWSVAELLKRKPE
jgi:WD40 repeat protein